MKRVLKKEIKTVKTMNKKLKHNFPNEYSLVKGDVVTKCGKDYYVCLKKDDNYNNIPANIINDFSELWEDLQVSPVIGLTTDGFPIQSYHTKVFVVHSYMLNDVVKAYPIEITYKHYCDNIQFYDEQCFMHMYNLSSMYVSKY